LTASGVLYGWSALVLVLTKEGTYLNYCKEGETNVKNSTFNTKSAQKDNIDFHLRLLVELSPLDFQILLMEFYWTTGVLDFKLLLLF
jgi:hypothetical protein